MLIKIIKWETCCGIKSINVDCSVIRWIFKMNWDFSCVNQSKLNNSLTAIWRNINIIHFKVIFRSNWLLPIDTQYPSYERRRGSDWTIEENSSSVTDDIKAKWLTWWYVMVNLFCHPFLTCSSNCFKSLPAAV